MPMATHRASSAPWSSSMKASVRSSDAVTPPDVAMCSSRMKIGKDAGAGGKDRLFLSENEACYFFRQAISGIEYLHNHGVAHRDVKLDNALLDDSVPPLLKISDFGFAKGDAEINTFTFIGESVRPRREGMED